MTHPPHVRIRDLRRQFDGRPILEGLSLDIAAGEFVVVVGESGGGKSTLLRILAGLDARFEGQRNVVDPVAVAFQDARLVPWKRVWQNVIFGLDGSPRVLRERSLVALAEVGLQARADQWPHTLSGGESQRVALARSLIREPRLLLLDEPLGALDALTRLRMQSLLRGLWQRHGFSVLLITHDIDEAIALAQRVLVLSGGRFVDEIAIPARRDDPVLLQALRDHILARLHIVDFV